MQRKDKSQSRMAGAFPKVAQLLLYGLVVGIFLNLPFLAKDVYHYFSKAGAFDQIHLGMPAADADRILLKEDIICGINRACYFQDFWRQYEILLDPGLREVEAKSYRFKERRPLLARLLHPNPGWQPKFPE